MIDEEEFPWPADLDKQLAADYRQYDREQRFAALRMLWGRPIVDRGATRRRRDGVICYERNRGEEWTLWRAIVASVALILNRRLGQRQIDRHHARTGSCYHPSVDLGYWDARCDGYGHSNGYLWLYANCRVTIGTDSESFM